MGTRLFIDTLPLDETSAPFSWPLYRGTEARKVKIYGFGPRWAEYKEFAESLRGKAATLTIRGTKLPGSGSSTLDVSIPDVYVMRATRINDLLIEMDCYDSRILLTEIVGDQDFNMRFGNGYLPGTAKDSTTPHTYLSAIQAYCARHPRIQARLGPDAFAGVPDLKLESGAHLSAMLAPDPLGYLCDRAGCDLVVGLDGKWYFASREDATDAWFSALADYNWRTLPGFLALESITLRKPRTIAGYYWEQHTIRAECINATGTVAGYGPNETRVQLVQRYLDVDGSYKTLDELLAAHNLTGMATDSTIAVAWFSDSAQGCLLHPLDTFERKLVWSIIKRDWRRLLKIDFPNGNRGGWDQWRFGQIQEDGSVEPVSVECTWVQFTRVVSSDLQGTFEGRPWTFNNSAPSPFKAVWDDGPESGVIRLVVEDSADRMRDERPPLPGTLVVPRQGGGFTALGVASVGGGYDNALRIIGKGQLDNGEGQSTAIKHLRLYGREDASMARMATSFQAFVYLTARRFMPNDKTRWHSESNEGFSNGDIDLVELPPSGEVQAYRTYVGGDHVGQDTDGRPWSESDGLGKTLNYQELADDAARRAEVWKLTHCLAVTGEGTADTLNLATRLKIVNGPVQEVALNVHGPETYTTMSVGNLADDKARAATATKRLASRGVDVQGRRQ